LGLDGLAVERVGVTAGGVKIVQLVTSDPDVARCPGCQVASTSGKEWWCPRPKDLPCGGRAVAMQQRWRYRTEQY
jgi:transposase